MKVLHLENNQIVAIDHEAFDDLEKVRKIFAQNNQIESLSDSLFVNLDSLRVLNFTNNPGTPFPIKFSLMRTDARPTSIARPATIALSIPVVAPRNFTVKLRFRNQSYGAYRDIVLSRGEKRSSVEFDNFDTEVISFGYGGHSSQPPYLVSIRQNSNLSYGVYSTEGTGFYGFKVVRDSLCIYGTDCEFTPVTTQAGAGGSRNTTNNSGSPDTGQEEEIRVTPPQVSPIPPEEETLVSLPQESLPIPPVNPFSIDDILAMQNQKTYAPMPPVPGNLMPETLTQQAVEDYINSNNVDTVEKFIAALPDFHKVHFVSVFESESPSKDFVSPVHPRVISWGATAHFILTWLTDPDSPAADQVEFLQQDADNGRWIAGVIDFSGGSPAISNPTSCQTCHSSINRPIYGSKGVWEGTEDPDRGSDIPHQRLYLKALSHYMNPRIRLLDYKGYELRHSGIRVFKMIATDGQYHLAQPNWEFSSLLESRHGEVLFQRLKSRSDYRDILSDALCRPNSRRSVILEYLDPDYINMRQISGSGKIVQGINRVQGADHSAIHALLFKVMYDLAINDANVRELYQSTVNNYGDVYANDPTGRDLLYYPPGTSTAYAEVTKLHETLFMDMGQEFINSRFRYNVSPRYTFSGMPSHLNTFIPKVCEIVR